MIKANGRNSWRNDPFRHLQYVVMPVLSFAGHDHNEKAVGVFLELKIQGLNPMGKLCTQFGFNGFEGRIQYLGERMEAWGSRRWLR